MPDLSLTLVSHPLCPFVQRAAIVLLEKGVPFERINVDLSAKPDWFLALSPTGKVPLLKVRRIDGEDAILFESMVICEYLEETQGGAPMYSDDALLRARQRAWIEFATPTLADAWQFLNATDPARPPSGQRSATDSSDWRRSSARDRISPAQPSAWSMRSTPRSSATSPSSIPRCRRRSLTTFHASRRGGRRWRRVPASETRWSKTMPSASGSTCASIRRSSQPDAARRLGIGCAWLFCRF